MTQKLQEIREKSKKNEKETNVCIYMKNVHV